MRVGLNKMYNEFNFFLFLKFRIFETRIYSDIDFLKIFISTLLIKFCPQNLYLEIGERTCVVTFHVVIIQVGDTNRML